MNLGEKETYTSKIWFEIKYGHKNEQTEPRKNVTGSEKYPSKPKSFLRGNRHTFEKQKRKKLVFLVFGE